MKIGFFTDGFLPQPNGVSTSVYESAKELQKRGHEVVIVAPKYPGYEDRELNVIRIPSIRIKKQPELRVGFGLPNRSLKKILDLDFDIIHAHSGGPVTLLGWEIARLKKIPLIGTYHTLWNRYTHYFLKGKIVTPKMVERTTKILGNRFDYLIAPSERVRKELKSYGVKKPIIVIPSGIDIERFKVQESGFLRNRLGIKNESIMLFVGRLGREKSPDFILKVFKEVQKKEPKTHLVLVGDGPDKKKLESLSKKIGIFKNTHFLGEINNKDISKVYHDATVFVFSSTSETQGLVVPEALSSGLPVVAIDDPAFECVENGKNGFLVKKDKKEFALKILSIIKDEKLRQELSKNALESSQKFSVKSTVDALEATYFELFEKNNKRSVARSMGENERKEQFFVINLAFWVSVVVTRGIVFALYPLTGVYPKMAIGHDLFYYSSLGLLLLLVSTALFIKKRKTGLIPLLFLGWGFGWIANEIWALIVSHKTIMDYWSFYNLIPIVAFGTAPLFFFKNKSEKLTDFYINTREQIHINPKNPKVTVVVPAYNEADFIGTTLKSILNQTYKNFELIVVDNNSSDNTGEIAKKYGARVVVERQKGVANARQAGFFTATGDIIVTIDADSVAPENWLERIVLEYEKDTAIVAFGGLGYFYSGPVSARAVTRYVFSIFWIIDKILSGGWNMAGFNMSVKKSAFLKIGGFNTKLTLGEDIDLSEKLRKVGKIKVDPDFCVYVSGRRFRNGVFSGVATYAPSWFMRVIFRQDKFLTFNPVRSEKSSSKLSFIPLGFVLILLVALFFITNYSIILGK